MAMNSTISFFMNIIIVVVTAILVFGLFRRDGKWDLGRARNAFRFFTVQSNTLCAISALFLLLYPDAEWTYYLKYIGTCAVTVTMMTVLLFLGPVFGYQYMFKGSDLFMHLLTPLLAIVSLCVFESKGMSPVAACLGLLPVALYAPLYLNRIIFAPKEKRWDDFYGFNRNGKWYVSYFLMHLGAAIICIVMYFLLNAG